MFEQHFSSIPLSKSRKYLFWKGEILDSYGILRVVPRTLRDTEIYLDFHIFDIIDEIPLILVGQPITSLISPERRGRFLSLRLGKEEEVSVDLTRVLNTRVEPKPEVDLLEEVMSLSPEE